MCECRPIDQSINIVPGEGSPPRPTSAPARETQGQQHVEIADHTIAG